VIPETHHMFTRNIPFAILVVISLALVSAELSDDTLAGEQIADVLQTYGSAAKGHIQSSGYGGDDEFSADDSSVGFGSDLPGLSGLARSSQILPNVDSDAFLDLEPVNPSDLRLSSIPQSRSSTGPHVRIRLGSKGGRGREKDEEKIAALLEASKLAQKSMQTLKVYH
jgi:hypothetical protein